MVLIDYGAAMAVESPYMPPQLLCLFVPPDEENSIYVIFHVAHEWKFHMHRLKWQFLSVWESTLASGPDVRNSSPRGVH